VGVAFKTCGCDDWWFIVSSCWKPCRRANWERGGPLMQTRKDVFPFDYEVPRRLVAQEPMRHRADARLMVVDRRAQTISHHHVRDLPELLRAGDRLVLNDTKVIRAQLSGVRVQTGGAGKDYSSRLCRMGIGGFFARRAGDWPLAR
jgi:hypothetical protein